MKLKRNIYYSGLLFSFLIFFIPSNGYSQNVRELTLEDAIELAQEQSLDAFISKNMYLVSYWQFRSYKAERRPWLAFNPSPAEYTNSTTTYLNNDGIVSYVRENSLTTQGLFSLKQNIASTGGSVSVYSGLERVENYLETGGIAFNSAPISVGISQPLFQYNQYRWKRKIEPVKFEKAKKEYIESVEVIARQAVYFFFNLLDAQQTFNIAGLNKATADTFYQKSLGRYERGAIALKDLQRLELNQLNSALEYESAQLELKRIEFSLKSFLRLSESEEIKLIIPDSFPTIKINPQLALEKALENNPNILDYKQRLIESDQNIARARGETGIQSNLNVNLGWGKSGNTLESVYYDLDKNRNVQLGLYVPIVDWGLSKGTREMAKFNKEVVVARVEKERIEFEQDVMMSAIEFNMLESQLNSVTKAREIAEKSYKTISERFLLGKENLETLYAARNERDNALRSYYRKLREIWIYYYYIRGITLYDFEKGQGLIRNFDDLFGL